jgi:NADPH-dependent 2,4-dienoyl-CoA reductase/sulfur reductase-like enzyme
MAEARIDDDSRVVIVGASLAGLTTAESLRIEGFGGSITLIGDEVHAPYSRPPLSKQVLAGVWAPHEAALRGSAELDSLGLRLLTGRRATGLNIREKYVTVDDEIVQFDHLVIATGVTARRPPTRRRLAGVHSLRTVDDVVALQNDLERAERVVVLGSGVLGSEIAAAIRKRGIDVTLVGRSRRLSLGQVGDLLSPLIARLHEDHGVKLRLGGAVTEIVGDTAVTSVSLSDDSSVPADLVVAAIGCEPATEWLEGSGLDLSDGVVCDSAGMAAPDIYAVGDVASWRDPLTGVAVRAEHQSNAIEQAQAVAHLLATGEPSPVVLPFFWSELFDTRIQAFGRFPAEVPLETVAGDPEDGSFVAASVRDGRVFGVVGWNSPRDFRKARAQVLAPYATDITQHAELVGSTKGSTL